MYKEAHKSILTSSLKIINDKSVENFLLCFIPLFVAMDVLGIVPIFVSLTEARSDFERKRLVSSASLTALVISVVFLFTGKILFNFLGITADDFRIAGGLVLLILAILDLVSSQEDESRRPSKENIGIVPVGIPLIMGPAALTTILILEEVHGPWIMLSALVANVTLVWIVFRQAHWFSRVMGQGGAKAFAKVSSLFLAAIAIMMIRVGLQNILNS